MILMQTNAPRNRPSVPSIKAVSGPALTKRADSIPISSEVRDIKFSSYFSWIVGGHGTVLRNAAAEGNLDLVKKLLEEGTDINSVDSWSSDPITSLTLAIMNSHIEVAEYLISKGADPNIGSMPPLEQALDNNLPEIAKLLLERNACSNFTKDEIWTGIEKPNYKVFRTSYLTEAIRRNQLDIMVDLINHNAFLAGNQTDFIVLAKNPLTVAVEVGNVRAVEILLSRGAQIEEKNCSICNCEKCQKGPTSVKRGAGKNALQVAKELLKQEPHNPDRQKILELLLNPDLILKQETVLNTPPERLLLECLEKVSPICASLAMRDNLAQFLSPDAIEYMGESISQKAKKSPDDATILKNKLCILYSQEEEPAAKQLWDDIAIKAFGAPIIVLAGIGGLHKVLGMEDVKDELVHQVINPLIKGKADCYSGVILTGPPGTGKTFLAYQIAEHLGYPIHVVNSSELLTNLDGQSFYGEASKRIDELFKKAKEEAPCVLFFDEIDSIGRIRSKTNSHSASIDTNQIIQNINELIRFNAENPTQRVLMLGAANFLSHLDSALIRPGRVLHIEVSACDYETKIKILKAQIALTNIHSAETWPQIIHEIANDKADFPPSDLIDILKRARNMAEENAPVSEAQVRKAWESVRKTRMRVNQQIIGTN